MAAEEMAIVFSIGVILVSATIFHYLAKMLKQPPILAYLLAGLTIGPMLLGSLGISLCGIPLGVSSVSREIFLLSELGVAFLLFSVGVETDFSKLKGIGKIVILGSILQVAITSAVVILSTGMGMLSFDQSIYLGVILSFSSTMVVIKILSDERRINTLHGRLIIGFLLVQDVLVILAMPILANINQTPSALLVLTLLGGAVTIIVLAYILSRFVYPLFFRFAVQSDELLFLGAVSICFIFILLSNLLNFAPAVGAFIAGVSLSTLPYSLEVDNKIKGLRDFFATIFFVTLGIQITPDFLSFSWGIILLIVFVVFILKPLIYYLITLFYGYGARVSLLVALALAQISEFSFIIAHHGRAFFEKTPGLYSTIILCIALSMAITPYLMQYSNAIYLYLERIMLRFFRPFTGSRRFNRKIMQLEKMPLEVKDHVVILGGGMMGSSIAEALHKDYPLIIVDHDSEVILKFIRKGMNAIYGSIDNHEVWDKINLKEIKLLIISAPDINGALYLAKYAKKVNPKIAVFARAHHYRDALALYKVGVDFVVMPLIMASNKVLEYIVEFMKTGSLNKSEALRNEYINYLENKVKEELAAFGR